MLSTVLLLAVLACKESNEIDFDKEKQAILKLHKAQRDYHFDKDSIAFANQLSNQFISVNKGEIKKPERSHTISRYHNYFSSVEFLKWDDISDPVIRFSNDGSMAYTIVDKIVEVSNKAIEGSLSKDKTHFAWTAIYKKYGNEWKIDCVTSTNKPVKD
ncbi:MAG: hypothetical protein HKN40_00805 [Winogradskyella sp.]|uniref:hypothetical protein n=1 Tax=Winogradskyella sp. TaxID=1883156 RepID=UPI00181846C7|nr:hypothetical protein [Winogradskyella sp.]